SPQGHGRTLDARNHNIAEVTPSSGGGKTSGVSKRDNEGAPLKSGTVADLDEDMEKGEGEGAPIVPPTKESGASVRLEYQRQQLISERQQFHLEQLKAAEILTF
ncbi:uncharacterized protein LOC113470628, partial [Diaphorina citri]|uniref:Uncharacterized protein LOC113470628 n=1 Tax=Diaphorina citri TaxID=121845 RepID=A0A3Q0J964_DIACI